MARRTIQAPKDLTVESPIDDHSDLSVLYPQAKAINDNPISTPAEISDRHKRAYIKQVKHLRKSALQIGVSIVTPFIIALFAVQQVVLRITDIPPNDIGAAMFIVFTSFLFLFIIMFSTYFLYKRTVELINGHDLRASPLITTILVCVALATPLAFKVTQIVPSPLLSYVTSLVLLVFVAIAVSISLVFLWTSQASARVKIALLIVHVALFLVLAFL